MINELRPIFPPNSNTFSVPVKYLFAIRCSGNSSWNVP